VKPPNPYTKRKNPGSSLCIACDKWTEHNQIFQADSVLWVLCLTDFVDYWENTDEVPEDYKWYMK
jgi:hypothetical protein